MTEKERKTLSKWTCNSVCLRWLALALVFAICCIHSVFLTQSIYFPTKETEVENKKKEVEIKPRKKCDHQTNFNYTNAMQMQKSAVQSEDGFHVPNVVHYIWYADKPVPLKFFHMLSVLSAEKYIKPHSIYFHTNFEPVGEYWERVKKNVKSLKIMHRKPSTCLFGQKIKEPKYGTSQSNVDRLVVLMEHGGIYLDLDVIVVQSFDPLRKYPCTVGLESPHRVCGGAIVCAADSPFLMLWLEHFIYDYQIDHWAYNSGLVPTALAKRYPHLVHAEQSKLAQPDYVNVEKIWGDVQFDWTQNFALHLYWRAWKRKHGNVQEPDDQSIKKDNSSFGQLAKAVLQS